MTSTVEHTFITVKCDYLTVEQYSSMLGIEPVTVRQWIRRGKLRHAKKNGRDWLIPDTEDKPQRGFTSVQYIVEKEAQIESDEFPLLSACESIFILQDQGNKRKFICYLNNYKTKFNSKLDRGVLLWIITQRKNWKKLYKLFLQLSVDVKKHSQNLWRVPLSTHSSRTG
ncbi:MAG: helix-turn-helix domain-containing protein [Bacillota bacterium]